MDYVNRKLSWKLVWLVFNFRIRHQFNASKHINIGEWKHDVRQRNQHADDRLKGLFKLLMENLTRFSFSLSLSVLVGFAKSAALISIAGLFNTYFFSRFPAPVSRNPFAKGLLSIFNCVICRVSRKITMLITCSRLVATCTHFFILICSHSYKFSFLENVRSKCWIRQFEDVGGSD